MRAQWSDCGNNHVRSLGDIVNNVSNLYIAVAAVLGSRIFFYSDWGVDNFYNNIKCLKLNYIYILMYINSYISIYIYKCTNYYKKKIDTVYILF